MIYHFMPFFILTRGSRWFRACAFGRPFRVDDEAFVTAPDAKLDAELIFENMNDQQQDKHLLYHFCSYMNS